MLRSPGLGGAPGGDEGDDAGGDAHRRDVVEGRAERLEDVERGEHEDGEEDGVVVEDGEGGGLVLGHLVLLPQDALVLLLAADLLVVVKLAGHLLEERKWMKLVEIHYA